MVSDIERNGEVNYLTLKEISKVLKLSVDNLQENDITDFPNAKANDPYTKINSGKELIISSKRRTPFCLKETITNQWKLLFEPSK